MWWGGTTSAHAQKGGWDFRHALCSASRWLAPASHILHLWMMIGSCCLDPVLGCNPGTRESCGAQSRPVGLVPGGGPQVGGHSTKRPIMKSLVSSREASVQVQEMP